MEPSLLSEKLSIYSGGVGAAAEAGVSGSLNLNQVGMIVTSDNAAVMIKGRRGLKRSHNCAPTQGAGKEMNPRLP